MKNKIGIIEIGSRGIRVLIAEVESQRIKPIFSRGEQTRLGEAFRSGGIILKEAIDKTVRIISKYHEVATRLDVNTLKILGTEVLRKSSYKDLEPLFKFYPNIRILTEQQEAYFSLVAALKSLDFIILDKTVLLIDQGAGSTEIVCGRIENEHPVLLDFKSYKLDTCTLVKLWEEENKDWHKLRQSLKSRIMKYTTSKYGEKASYCVGLGINLTDLAWLKLRRMSYEEKYASRKIHGERLSVKSITKYINLATNMPRHIELLLGSPKNIEDIVSKIAGLMVVESFLKKYSKSNLIVSGQGLRYGVVWSLACNYISRGDLN